MYCRCNLAMILLTDLVVDGLDLDCHSVDWSVHLPLMLHIIFLGLGLTHQNEHFMQIKHYLQMFFFRKLQTLKITILIQRFIRLFQMDTKHSFNILVNRYIIKPNFCFNRKFLRNQNVNSFTEKLKSRELVKTTEIFLACF